MLSAIGQSKNCKGRSRGSWGAKILCRDGLERGAHNLLKAQPLHEADSSAAQRISE